MKTCENVSAVVRTSIDAAADAVGGDRRRFHRRRPTWRRPIRRRGVESADLPNSRLAAAPPPKRNAGRIRRSISTPERRRSAPLAKRSSPSRKERGRNGKPPNPQAPTVELILDGFVSFFFFDSYFSSIPFSLFFFFGFRRRAGREPVGRSDRTG